MANARVRLCGTCGLACRLATDGPIVLIEWDDGSSERVTSIPPDDSIRCRAHRAGSPTSHVCREGFTHSTVDGAESCAGHDAVFDPHVAGG